MHPSPHQPPPALPGAGSQPQPQPPTSPRPSCTSLPSLGPMSSPALFPAQSRSCSQRTCSNPDPFARISPSPRLQSQTPMRKWNPASLKSYLSPRRRLPCPCVPPRPRRTTEDGSLLAWGPCPCLCAQPWLRRGPTAPLTSPTIPTYRSAAGRPLAPSTQGRSKPSSPSHLLRPPHPNSTAIADLTSFPGVSSPSWASEH